jgi:hypothetical protein
MGIDSTTQTMQIGFDSISLTANKAKRSIFALTLSDHIIIPIFLENTLVDLRPFLTVITLFFLVTTPLLAEDYDDLLQEQIEEANEKMQQTKEDIVEQNLDNPQTEEMYEQHLEQGGTMSEEEFAYMYGATGGQTQEAINRYNLAAQDNQEGEDDVWWKWW